MNIFDVLILGFVILGAWHGYRKGLISGIINLAGSIIGFVIASAEYLKVLNWLESFLPLRKWMEPIVYRLVLSSVKTQVNLAEKQTLERIQGILPPEWRGAVSGNFPDLSVYAQNAIQQLTQRIAGILTENILQILAFLLTYFCVAVLIQILASLILSPLGVFGGIINRGGGFLLGALSTVVGLAVLFGLLSPLLQFLPKESGLALVQQAQFYPHLMQIFKMLQEIFKVSITEELLNPLNFTKGLYHRIN